MGAAALGYAAFGPRPAKERRDGRVVLDYWEKWTQNEADAMRAIVDRFNASQDRLWVRYFSTGTIDQKALIAIAGGDPPDILGLGNFSIPAYAEAGAIIPLDDLAAKAGIRREDYAPALWPMVTHTPPGHAPESGPRTSQGLGGGPFPAKLYGVVNTCGALALFYNRAMFREVGLDPDKPPQTIAELDKVHRRLTRFDGVEAGVWPEKPGPEMPGLVRAGFLHNEPNWWKWHWGYHFGGSLYDQTTDTATAADEPNVRAFEWLMSYPRAMGAKNVVKFQTGFGVYGSAEHPFLTGKVAMTQQGPWLANVIHQYKPDLDYGVAPFPVDEAIYDEARPVGLLDCDVLVVPRGAKRPEASFEFIAFTQRPENIEALSAAHGKNSPLVKQSEGFERGHVNKYVRVHSKIANSPRAFAFPRTRTWQEYVAEFDAAQQRMWRLETGALEALTGVQRAAQAQLDRAAEARRRRARA
jgi:ABC-type glycerol-3-phosphate transport system substrate-binding protein